MAYDELAWEPLLQSDAPTSAVLQRALFTTYDRPDGQLVAEQLLRTLLRLDHEPAAEGRERDCFLVDLSDRLRELHGRIVMVSSTSREEPIDPLSVVPEAYSWLWRSIHALVVGHNGAAIQHAKLWMLHWSVAEPTPAEYLEIVVSSANLTGSAFSSQMQCAWRGLIPLTKGGSAQRRKSWGILPTFIEALAQSTNKADVFEQFSALLARADCPEGVQFIASVPGTFDERALRKTPWGSAGLATIFPASRGPVKVGITSPFIGEWTSGSLARWCNDAGSRPDLVRLVWVDMDHHWASAGRWTLTRKTRELFVRENVRLLHFGAPDEEDGTANPFHVEHRQSDTRWSHAKVYHFQRGRARRVLMTSANFSPSAWGRETSGGLQIGNFELGVCLSSNAWLFGGISEFVDTDRIAVVDRLQPSASEHIEWAAASWDGEFVVVSCRCRGESSLSGTLMTIGGSVAIGDWQRGEQEQCVVASLPWKSDAGYPIEVRLCCDSQTVRIPVFDARELAAQESFVPPGIDDAQASTLHDELLFERFGGRLADDVERNAQGFAELPVRPDPDREGGMGDSYSVEAFELARRHLSIVDSWQSHVDRARKSRSSAYELISLLRQGRQLYDAFERCFGREHARGPSYTIGLQLALEELKTGVDQLGSSL